MAPFGVQSSFTHLIGLERTFSLPFFLISNEGHEICFTCHPIADSPMKTDL